MPGLRPSGSHVLPVHEYPSTLLHWLSGGYWCPAMDAPMDFSGWFEAYLGGQRDTFDERFNTPRIGRVLMARGRDAADVAIVTTFGPNTLTGFEVTANEIVP